jgi:hypothetical protein
MACLYRSLIGGSLKPKGTVKAMPSTMKLIKKIAASLNKITEAPRPSMLRDMKYVTNTEPPKVVIEYIPLRPIGETHVEDFGRGAARNQSS